MREQTQTLCDECGQFGNTGFLYVEDKGVIPCPTHRAQTLLKVAQIPKRFEGATFDNFEAATLPLQRVVNVSRRFVAEYPVDYGLMYMGSCGTGKTHLAVSVMRELMKRGVTCRFYDFRDLLSDIRSTFNANSPESESSLLEPLISVEVLMLDELGAEKPTEWALNTMTRIVNRRYNEKRVTLFTTNYTDTRVDSLGGETLSERVGDRFRSRLDEMCRIIPVEGEDYRKLIRTRRGVNRL